MKDQLYSRFYDPTESFKDEPRAFCYDLSCKLIGEAKKQTAKDWYTHEKTIEGVILLLFCWNFAAQKTKRLTISKIHDLLDKNKGTLKDLERYSLLTIDDDCCEKIKMVYEDFRSLFGQTGASKALSLLNRELFVMWDTKIRDRLKKSLVRGISNGEKHEHYVRFLRRMRELSEEYSLESRIPEGAILAKKIDEFHYAEIVMKNKAGNF